MARKLAEFKYFHNFAIMVQNCETCTVPRNHIMTLASMSKNFNNATRWKICDVCGTQALAPVEEDLNRFRVS